MPLRNVLKRFEMADSDLDNVIEEGVSEWHFTVYKLDIQVIMYIFIWILGTLKPIF